MRKMLFILFVALNCYGLFSCNTGYSEKPPDVKAVPSTLDKKWAKSFLDSVNSKFSEQIASGDTAALASHYWPDAELLLDNSEVVRGKDIIYAWGSAIRLGAKAMTFATTDITGTPTFIIETGNYDMMSGNKSLIDRGKYVVVWENRNGEWKLYRDIGSTSMPAPK